MRSSTPGACSEGYTIFTRSWQPPTGSPRAALVLVHGFNSHSGHYLWVGEQFAGAGLAVYALDLHGRGRSEGDRYHIDSIGESPRWHNGRLWLADWGAGEILAVDGAAVREHVASAPSVPCSIDWLPKLTSTASPRIPGTSWWSMVAAMPTSIPSALTFLMAHLPPV